MLVQFKTRQSVVAVNPVEVSDVKPYQTDAGMQTMVRMANRVEHIVFEPMDRVLAKLNGKPVTVGLAPCCGKPWEFSEAYGMFLCPSCGEERP